MSINTILDRVDGSAAAMHSQADLIARAAERFAKAARDLADSCQAAVETVNRLAGDLRSHDESGEEDLAIAADMAATAKDLADRAGQALDDGEAMTGAVARGSEQVTRVCEDLMAISEDVRGTASAVSTLSGSSKRIGDFALSMGKIARQTHVLALNAAIEAARAAQQGHGFAVVAEQVRTLAGEAGRSARDVSNGVAELRDGIAQVADAISAGEERLLETSRVAGEARTTLERLGLSISHTLELVSESASAHEQHVGGIASLRDRLSALSAQKDKWASGFVEIEGAINKQVSAVDELSAARQQLLQLTQQLQTTATQIRDTTESSD